jgi:hypothetical protein
VRRTLPTLVSFAHSYAFKDNGPGLVWDSTIQEMVESNADERERAMDFPTGTTQVLGISEQQRRFYWAKLWTLTVLLGLFRWWLQNSSAWPQVWLAIWASMSSGRP